MTRISRNGISIELPNDWELWNQNRWAGTETMLAAKFWEKKWPNMEVTDAGPEPNTDVLKTQAFALRWVMRQGVEFLNEQFIRVSGFEAYEFCYKRKSFFRTFYFCKVVVIINKNEYLIQLASRDIKKDKPVFDQIVKSLQFEFAVR